MNLEGRVEALKALGNDVLRALPREGDAEWQTEECRRVQYVVWHDLVGTGGHRIVVVRYDEHLAGIYHRVTVSGFVIEPDETRRPLTESEGWDFS